jgi:hypothetical protein
MTMETVAGLAIVRPLVRNGDSGHLQFQLQEPISDTRHFRRPIESGKQCVGDAEKIRSRAKGQNQEGVNRFAPLDAAPDAVAAPFLAA